VQPATSLLRDLVRKRDFYAGGLMLLLGLGVALKGSTYRAGTLMHMGPGFLPTALGILLVLLGIAMLSISRVPFDWVVKLLAAAGLILFVRGILGSLLILWQR